MQHGPIRQQSLGALARVPAMAALALAAGVAVTACGSSHAASGTTGSHPATSATTVSHPAVPGSCAGVAGAHHARVVVESAPGTVVARCVGFAGAKIKALTLLTDSRVELGTQKYSFGVAICQVDNVPSHYSQCLPSGKNYWALFLSTDGHRWTSPSVGVSDVSVPAGGSLGLRYDPPKGTPAPPPPPTPA